METVRWGIIGVGDVTEVKSGPAFQKAAGSQLVAVMRRTGAKAADYAARHGVPRWYDNADELIHDDEVDAVYVATPPDSHREYAIRVLEAGKPVYVEKPMARSASECIQMNDAAESAGLPLFVAYYRRAMPRFETVRRLLTEGAIGRLQAVTIRQLRPADPTDGDVLPWRLRPDVSGGGHFVDLGSHTLDLLDHLVGPIEHVTGHAKNRAGTGAAEDLVGAVLQFESGVVGTGLWCFDAGEELDEVQLVGSRGTLSFSVFDEQPLELRTNDGLQSIPAPYPDTVQQPLVQSVVDELLGRGMSPSTGVSALRTARVVDAILTDHRAAHGVTLG
ncbi:Gfo/Idh/MocA family protein [Tessaracoccus antarcticus]|uniref:Gfo/Idh/MocA family oxidoreductase n=1 Tax=Tessaracoccus antarcticus TaxID=2479848 RepID=A0A3M0GB32_9ACTN|nr:Gfo/Idh/MocA family oxidoreductase [Tessaracoccus antarcticus]RMB58783.1 gfo/Idh/MocA family oxidoreductase [Tessaracoccus antarcticus]